MKILYLSPGAALGGAERSLLDVMAAVLDAVPRTELHLVVTGDGPLIAEAERLGVRVTLLSMPRVLARFGESALIGPRGRRTALTVACHTPSTALATCLYVQRLRNAIKEISPQIIHSNGIKFHFLTWLAGLQTVPVVWHIRDFLGARPMMARVLRWAASRPSAAVAISAAVATDAAQILPRLPIHLIYNAVDTEYFSPGPADGRQLDALSGVPPCATGNIVRIGLVATYARWKGQDVFLDAARLLRESRADLALRFYLIGGAIYGTSGSEFSENELRTQAAERNVVKQVAFVGFQRDMAEIYRCLDIVVHASTRPEPFGRTIVEAMACARAVVVSGAGGATELFTPEHDAVSVPPRDAHALAAAIARLAENHSLRRRLGENARRTAVARFHRARLGPEILGLYESVLAG